MSRIFKKIVTPFFQTFVHHYFKKSRAWRYNNIKIWVDPGVFFPHFTLSTKHLLQFLETKNLTDKSFLELGCGTGAISILAARKGARVVSSDINPAAVDNCGRNAQQNHVELRTILSDLFTNIPKQTFDVIIINPPYYPKNPQNPSEQAWYCGENFEYFTRLFNQLALYINHRSEVYMILSEDCEIEQIKNIAAQSDFEFNRIAEKRKWGEWNYIFQILSKMV